MSDSGSPSGRLYVPPPSGRIWARWGFDPLEGVFNGIEAEWLDGRWKVVREASRPSQDIPAENQFPDHILTPGLVNAHAHLDYAWLHGRLPAGVGFSPWLREMIRQRRIDTTPESERIAAAERALLTAAAEGMTEIWDIRSHGYADRILATSGFPHISFYEWIAPRRATWETDWQAWQQQHPNARDIEIHSLYSVVEPAAGVVQAHASPPLRLAIHLAESPDEIQFLEDQSGPMAEMFADFPDYDVHHEMGMSERPIMRANRLELLGARTLAVHCNMATPEEIEMLADTESSVAFCPLSHQFFGYPPYPLNQMLQRNVHLGLGTDSPASNPSFSMRDELRRFVELAGGLKVERELFGYATGFGLNLGADETPYSNRGQFCHVYPAQFALWQPARAPRLSDAGMLEAVLDPATQCALTSQWRPDNSVFGT